MITLNTTRWYKIFDGDVRISLRPWEMDLAIEADAHAEEVAQATAEKWRQTQRRIATYTYIFGRLLADWEGINDLDAESDESVKAEPNPENAAAFIKQIPEAFGEIARVIDDHCEPWFAEKKDSKASSNGKRKAVPPTAKSVPTAEPPAPEGNGALAATSAPTSSTG